MAPSRFRDMGDAPLVMKLVFAVAGIVIMLLAMGVIPVDPSKFRGPRWVIFIAGLVFFLVAVVLFIGKHRYKYPAGYLFVAATLCSAFTAVLSWVALYSKGPFGGGLSIGPAAMWQVGGSDLLPRILFGIGALLTLFLSCLGWTRWWRALRGKPVNLRP